MSRTRIAIVGFGALGFTTASLVRVFGGTPTIFTGRPIEPLPACLEGALLVPKTVMSPDTMDIVVNTSDAWSDYLLSVQLARRGGVLVLLGFPGRDDPQPPFNPLASQYLYDKLLSVRQAGHVADADVPAHEVRFTLRRNLVYLHGLIQSGTLDVSPLLAWRVSWRELASVYDGLVRRRPGTCTALLEWGA